MFPQFAVENQSLDRTATMDSAFVVKDLSLVRTLDYDDDDDDDDDDDLIQTES